MFENFTLHARKAVSLSRKEALRRGSDCIEAAHFVLGISKGHGVGAKLLKQESDCRRLLDKLNHLSESRATHRPLDTSIPFSPSAWRALKGVHAVAEQLVSQTVGTGHLVIASLNSQDPLILRSAAECDLPLERLIESLSAILKEDGYIENPLDDPNEPVGINSENASEFYLGMVTNEPDSGQARLRLREALDKKFEKSEKISKASLEVLKRDLDGKLREISDSRIAINLCQEYLVQDPTHSEVRAKLASLLYTQGYNSAARVEASMAMCDNPNNREALKVLIEINKRLGREADVARWQRRLQELEGGQSDS